MGRDRHFSVPSFMNFRFQSTRPRWGATGKVVDLLSDQQAFQSTRPRWGATLGTLKCRRSALDISIHTPQVGRDPCERKWFKRMVYFNPHAPGGARLISQSVLPLSEKYFNPHAPGGARPHRLRSRCQAVRFQSTRPRWGATLPPCWCGFLLPFQSTRPRWGATQQSYPKDLQKSEFQSTRPRWGATA